MKEQKVIYHSIGIINTPFKDQSCTPIQGCFNTNSVGEVKIFPKYLEGLKDIEGFSYIFLIYHFHLANACSLLKKPFLDNEVKGIFSIRYFERPNNIGLSLVRLHEVNKNILKIGEVDIVDGTPLLDIKPYVPDFDNRDNVKKGWYEQASNRKDYEENKGIPFKFKSF